MKRISLVAVLAVAATGCGKKPTGPVEATPEMRAEQKQAEQDVRNAEAAARKGQKPERTADQTAEDAERARSRGR